MGVLADVGGVAGEAEAVAVVVLLVVFFGAALVELAAEFGGEVLGSAEPLGALEVCVGGVEEVGVEVFLGALGVGVDEVGDEALTVAVLTDGRFLDESVGFVEEAVRECAACLFESQIQHRCGLS